MTHKIKLIITTLLAVPVVAIAQQGLKDAMGKYCLIGAALNQTESAGLIPKTTDIVRKHFNSIVAENCMKSEQIQPKEGVFTFDAADDFVRYAEENKLTPIGHCLVWHSQAPKWFFVDEKGAPASREVMAQRIKTHIATVVGRYKGRIHGWDVVNEAIEDNGEYRRSPLYNILGEDFFEIAFKAAHEADPDAELYYNDYSMAKPGKRAAVCRLVRRLRAAGCRIDGVGMQSHNGMDYPNLKEYETSIDSFAACGVKVMMTELDLNVLPSPKQFGGAAIDQSFEYEKEMNPYKDGLPEEKAREIEQRYMQLFDIYYRHREQIARITLWGVSDATSWLNGWPIPGRTNYPLLFDREYKAKPIVDKIIKLYQ